MFPIDSNLLIGILIFATIPVYIWILKKLEPKSTFAKNAARRDSNNQDPKHMKKDKNVGKEILKTAQSKQFGSACSYYFGYLRTLPKSASLPDECLGCPKIIKCLTHASTSKSQVKRK